MLTYEQAVDMYNTLYSSGSLGGAIKGVLTAFAKEVELCREREVTYKQLVASAHTKEDAVEQNSAWVSADTHNRALTLINELRTERIKQHKHIDEITEKVYTLQSKLQNEVRLRVSIAEENDMRIKRGYALEAQLNELRKAYSKQMETIAKYQKERDSDTDKDSCDRGVPPPLSYPALVVGDYLKFNSTDAIFRLDYIEGLKGSMTYSPHGVRKSAWLADVTEPIDLGKVWRNSQLIWER